MHFSDRTQWIAGEASSAWDTHYQALAAAEHDPDVLVLSVGDPDFATPTPIIDAAITALQSGDTHYTPILGLEPLRSALSNHYASIAQTPISNAQIAVLAGAQNALFSAALCTLNPGDEVLTPDPVYVTYDAAIGVSGARLIRVPSASDSFRPDLAAIERAITPKTKAIAIATPNNPTGVTFSADELEAVVALAKKHQLWLWSDEVYRELVFETPHTSALQFNDQWDQLIVIGSMSKSFAMTGWRVGWMIAPKRLIEHIENLSLCMLYGLPGFIQQAAEYAISHGQHHIEAMRQTYQRRRDVLVRELKALPELKCIVPEAGMFLMVDVSQTGMTGATFAQKLYADQKVSVLDGAAFSPRLAHFVRLSFTQPENKLLDAAQRLTRFIRQS